MSEAQTPKKPSRLRMCCGRLWRGTKWLTLTVVVLGVIYILWTNHRGQRAADDMIRELRDRSIPPATEDKLADHENADRFYLAASELFKNHQPLMRKAPVLSSVDWPRFGEGFTPEQAALLKQIVDDNQLAFDVLRQVKPGDRARFGISNKQDTSHGMNLLGSARRTARWLKLDSLQAAVEGDLDRAVGDSLAALHFSRQFAGDESVIVALVRMSIAALGQDSFESLLSRSELSDDQLRAMGEALNETGSSLDVPRILRQELARLPADLKYPDLPIIRGDYNYRTQVMNKYMEMMTVGSFDDEDLFAMTAWERFRDAADRTYVIWCPGYVQLTTAEKARRILTFYDQVSDPAMNPIRLAELAEQVPDDEADASLRLLLRAVLRIRADLLTGQTATEVERFRLREGRWPNDLGEVYDEVPVDPYGHAMQMSARGDELRVYSIGPNGVDDSGIQSYERDQAIDTEGKDDLAFILLNPDRRNRPATTEIETEPLN